MLLLMELVTLTNVTRIQSPHDGEETTMMMMTMTMAMMMMMMVVMMIMMMMMMMIGCCVGDVCDHAVGCYHTYS